MRRIGVKIAHILIISFCLLLVGKSSVLAVDISFCTETNLDSKITLLKLDLTISFGKTFFSFIPVIDSKEYELDFEKAVVNKKIGSVFVEAGIKDWIWGQEIMYVPTYLHTLCKKIPVIMELKELLHGWGII